jgi:hypothetical protein
VLLATSRSVDSLGHDATTPALAAAAPAPSAPDGTEAGSHQSPSTATPSTTLGSHITRSTTQLAPSFFTLLPTRAPHHIQHFRTHFLPTAPICSCTLFPIYAHRQQGPSVRAEFLNHLCLDCIRDLLTCNWKTRPKALTALWTKTLAGEWFSNYAVFYSTKEYDAFIASCSRQQFTLRLDKTMANMEPWLLKRGVRRVKCAHANCTRIDCVLALAAV